jgi:hypothetical protein
MHDDENHNKCNRKKYSDGILYTQLTSDNNNYIQPFGLILLQNFGDILNAHNILGLPSIILAQLLTPFLELDGSDVGTGVG